jgi:hypothetical protein
LVDHRIGHLVTGAVAASGYYVAAVNPVTVQLHNHDDYEAAIGSVTASYQINSNKNVYDTSELVETWLLGSGALSSAYEVMATLVSGTLDAGSSATGTWLNCGGTSTWTRTNIAKNNSVKSASLTVSIRDVATHTVQATAAVTLQAESDSQYS